ncbi:glyoxalase superfamily protein [Nocardia miyunensis]|uniref:glyoxalase superfamily protein n=1 Tax=Nocardia miyunensis TaxID=282684 RepID=UPI000835D0B2|nr:glyoxalase superfamily protein [Nocardia miyunensis]
MPARISFAAPCPIASAPLRQAVAGPPRADSSLPPLPRFAPPLHSVQNRPGPRPIAVLRIYDVAKAYQFYCDYLGFSVDWEHRVDPGAPLYAGGDAVRGRSGRAVVARHG